MSNWDWAQITSDDWDSFKSKVQTVIESDSLIEAGVRSVNKDVNYESSSSDGGTLTFHVQRYNCGQNGHFRRHCKKRKSSEARASNAIEK